MSDEKGQALPLALVTLAVGALLLAPFLSYVSTSLVGSRIYGQAMTEQYSADAGIEWALWKLKGNPALTANATYDSAPLEPMPSEINGSAFPTTEIRFVSGGPGGPYTYDIRAQKGNTTISVRATASQMGTEVVSWQVN